MKLPLSIAQKLLALSAGQAIPAGQMKHVIVDKMVEDGLIFRQRTGAGRALLLLGQIDYLTAYLHNHFGIENLEAYVEVLSRGAQTRSEGITIAADSKIRSIRTFKGFLVNAYEVLSLQLNGKEFSLVPQSGTFQFIYDYEGFIPDPDLKIVGIENAENFRWIEHQQHLFPGFKPLFLSRYPQSQHGDVIRWLSSIPNDYLHFGDFDFEGMNLYLREYKKHLGVRSRFFVPENLDELIQRKGNRAIYNAQLHHQPVINEETEPGMVQLMDMLHRHKKVLEQEAMIGFGG